MAIPRLLKMVSRRGKLWLSLDNWRWHQEQKWSQSHTIPPVHPKAVRLLSKPKCSVAFPIWLETSNTTGRGIMNVIRPILRRTDNKRRDRPKRVRRRETEQVTS